MQARRQAVLIETRLCNLIVQKIARKVHLFLHALIDWV
jgi:phage terminase Nu1 subunit (DNA packaging protein)